MARVETLTDNFNDNSMDTNLWSLMSGTGTTAETGGQLTITPASNNPGATYDGYSSVGTFDFTGSQATIECVQGIASTTGVEQAFSIELNSSNSITLFLAGSNIAFRVRTSGSNNDTFTGRSDAAMRWWRIRESGGTVFFETSSNGNSWTMRRATTVSFAITSMRLKMSAGTWQNVASPGTAIFDNLNVLSTAPGAWLTT